MANKPTTTNDGAAEAGKASEAPKAHYATRAFNDAGTSRRFAAGDEIKNATPGEIENYLAAGLIADHKPRSPAEAEAAALDAALG